MTEETMPLAERQMSRRHIFGVAGIAAAALIAGPTALIGAVEAEAATVKIKTTTGLNVRTSSSTKGRRLGTLAKNSTVSSTGRASNGWYRISYKGRTGYVSNRYVKVVATPKKKAAAKAPAEKVSSRRIKLQTMASLNVRSSSASSGKRLGTLRNGEKFTATGIAANGWYRLTYRGKTGYVSNKYVKAVSLDGSKYVSTRNGLPTSARYFFKSNGADLYYLPNGAIMINDLLSGTVAWRDAKLEKKYGSTRGWYYVRTAGASGWVRTSSLRRSQPRSTRWTGRTRASQIRRMTNGRLSSANLVAISWDPGQNMIAGPALNDLTKMNAAFKKKFKRNLEIDLTYRTRGTQDYLYRELGPKIAARPGTSNHGYGLAIDFPEARDYDFGGKYYNWLKANANRYGWNHRHNLEKYTSSGRLNPYREAWHFEYIR